MLLFFHLLLFVVFVAASFSFASKFLTCICVKSMRIFIVRVFVHLSLFHSDQLIKWFRSLVVSLLILHANHFCFVFLKFSFFSVSSVLIFVWIIFNFALFILLDWSINAVFFSQFLHVFEVKLFSNKERKNVENWQILCFLFYSWSLRSDLMGLNSI